MPTTNAPAGASAPPEFERAVAGLSARSGLRRDIELTDLPAPTRLAPWSRAIGLSLFSSEADEIANGRLILLHDPAGVAAWEGVFRIVVFGTCEVDPEMAQDPLLAEVAWSWLTERLDTYAERYVSLGGTVTTTTSTRFGDIVGPPRVEELELRASWTPLTPNMGGHLVAFGDFLATAAGVPPEGVSSIGGSPRGGSSRRPG